jgi:hypothetical protein
MPRPIEPMERTPTVAKGADMIDSRRKVAAVVEGGLCFSQVDKIVFI